MSQDNHHRVDYVEFPVQNLAQARDFYAAAFGWSFTDYGPSYSAFHDGRLSGGLDADEAEHTKAPLVVLFSANLEDTLRQVEATGGKIVKPIYPFPGGRRFHFADPAGNELAVWSDR